MNCLSRQERVLIVKTFGERGGLRETARYTHHAVNTVRSILQQAGVYRRARHGERNLRSYYHIHEYRYDPGSKSGRMVCYCGKEKISGE